MSKTKKWMPFYVSDYLDDTGHLSTLEHGAYLLILLHLWRCRKPISDTDLAFRRVTRTNSDEWDSMRENILDLLTQSSGGWVQKRLMTEVDRAERKYKKRVKVIAEINKRRKDIPRLSHDKRDEQRDDNGDVKGATYTLPKKVYGNEDNNSAPVLAGSVGVADAPTDQPSTECSPTGEPDFVTVSIESGAKLKIDRWGGCDEIWAPRDCPQTRLTPAEALDLRRQVLETKGAAA